MMNATHARGEETSSRTLLSGAQAEFAAELGRVCGDLGAALRESARLGETPGGLEHRDRAVAGLRRQAQRAQGFRLHALAEELKILAEKASEGGDLERLAKAAEDAPKALWSAGPDEAHAAHDRPLTPVPNSGLRDRSAPLPLPVRGDFRVRIVGDRDILAWLEARTDVVAVEGGGRGDLLVVDARGVASGVAPTALREALEALVVVVGDRELARAHGAIAVDAPAELDGVVELAKSRREVALVASHAPSRSARDLGLELVEELHRALVEGIDPASAPVAVPLGRDPMITAALWSAIARIRELVSRRTEGAVRFVDAGPEGALALAAEISDEVRAHDRRRAGDRAGDVSLDGLRALVVDDDAAVTWFIAEQLRAAGMIVVEAYDGETARGLAERERPDVVVSDVVMPGMDGLTLGRALRRDVTLGDVPVVLLSWKEDLLRRVRELGSEAEGYVRKESDSEHLLAAVREALRPRVRLAQRLAKEETVHGRLDGMTAFTLARLAADQKKHARLVVRDGRHVFELEFVSGLLASCTRSGSDGSLLRGRRALASFLGVRSARFEVSPLTRQLGGETAKPLASAVEPLLERARASVELVVERWLSLAALEIDLDLVDSGAPALPGSLKRALDGLRDGVAPHRLVATGTVEADALLALMVDLARRGALVSARDNLGTDRLQEALERVRTRGLVEAPKVRFSRPIAVPVAFEIEADAAAEGANRPHVEEVVVATNAQALEPSPVAVVAPEDAPLDRSTLDVLTADAAAATLEAMVASADAPDHDPLATPREIPAVPVEPAAPPPLPVDVAATAIASELDAPAAASEVPRTIPSLPPPDEVAAAASAAMAPEAAVVASSPSVRVAAPIEAKTRRISWVGFLLALGLVALGGTVASWVAVRHLPAGRVPTVFR
jgi:DNA-binding response OmpR family regulator